MQSFDIENVNRAGHAERARRKHHAAKNVEADPDSPGELVVHVRHCAKSFKEPNVRRIGARHHDRDKYHAPESDFREFHFLPPRGSSFSAAATSSRRWLTQ